MGEPCFVALFPLEDLSSQVVPAADVWLASSHSFMLPGWTTLGEGLARALNPPRRRVDKIKVLRIENLIT